MTSSLSKSLSKAIEKGFNPSTFSSITTSQHSVFFFEGLDNRRLNPDQQLQISKFVDQKPDSNSFMVYNSFEAKRKLKDWFRLLPWVRPFYAIKANPVPILCKQLSEGGAGMDCASQTEIKEALDLGIPPPDIVYSNSTKNQNDLRWAYKNNIRLTTADSVEELLKIQRLAPGMSILWRIAIKQEQHDRQFWGFSEKFGDDIESPQSIHTRMKEIKDMGIRLHGIHFHSGSTRNGSEGFKKGILLAKQCISIGRQYNHRMEILDTGGGFPSGNLTKSILEAFQLTRNDPLGYKTFAEPGRHFSDNVFYLLTRIIGKKKKSNVQCYNLNQSIYHSFNCVMAQKVTFSGENQHYGKVEKGIVSPVGELEQSNLFGMTCCGTDIIGSQVSTPKQMKVGDWLCFGGLGSYSHGMKTNFNGMTSTEVVDYWSGDMETRVQQKEVQSPI